MNKNTSTIFKYYKWMSESILQFILLSQRWDLGFHGYLMSFVVQELSDIEPCDPSVVSSKQELFQHNDDAIEE